ncbi:MAG: aminotransferase class I/II-fold pyridoxal phosphate-dependent enzyme [Gammaproteobacteria bacterium]|nr:aminotransferase class I/II-fold pyridoxal phosphate-dependent enzyme [Gammaproteobacteria bacterium]
MPVEELERQYAALQGANLKLDLTRGKPAAAQLDLSDELDGILNGDFTAEDGTDVRNYGNLRGIPEARQLGAELLDVAPEDVMAGGNASLTLMFYVLDAAMHYGILHRPWRDAGPAKAICPVPGYDRHFTLTDSFGIAPVTVPIGVEGPDMDAVERLVQDDPTVRCIWCVPKHSNPTGCTYSPEVVERIAHLPKLAAPGFLVLWDNAYAVHDFESPPVELTPILPLARAVGTADAIAMFASTSKITHAGSGVAFLGGGAGLLDALERRFSAFMIGPDKVNQLRHARLLSGRLAEHMHCHAESVRPKFEAVQEGLEQGLGGTGLATWTRPRGGYFVSLNTEPGLAKEVVALAADAGVVLTPAGATFPGGKDPEDRNIRIAPTFATLDEVVAAIDVLALCIRLASARKSTEAA